MARPSTHPGGKEYIGPKGQAHIPDRDWEVIKHLMENDGLGQADAIRFVVAEGAAVLRDRGLISE
jgi:hypothetical protein